MKPKAKLLKDLIHIPKGTIFEYDKDMGHYLVWSLHPEYSILIPPVVINLSPKWFKLIKEKH